MNPGSATADMENITGESSAGPSTVTEDRLKLINALEHTIMGKLPDESPLSDISCIFRVPHLIRRHNPEAYQPHVVSIGPLHHGGEKFKHLETVKRWYMKNLLISCPNISLRNYIEDIIINEKRARLFYAVPLDHISKIDFIEMMILDGCFLTELFRKSVYEKNNTDPIFNMTCMFQHICNDLLLLENQLPWFVLEILYPLTKGCTPIRRNPRGTPLPVHLDELVLIGFTSEGPLKHNCTSYVEHLKKGLDCSNETLHILDLVRSSIVFSFQARDVIPINFGIVRTPKEEFESEIPFATTLSEAGVKFKRGTDGCIMNIEFRDGVLTIPPLEIGELTEPLFRNLVAFEQCYHGRSDEITSYAALMKKLLGSSKDMLFLREAKIIGNWLSDEDGFQFFNKLYNDTVLKKYFYEQLCREVNSYYEVSFHKWLADLKREHFGNPWKIMSLIVGIVLVLLTGLQAAYIIHKWWLK